MRLNEVTWTSHQPVRTAPPVAQLGQWPGHELDMNLGSLCQEISPVLPSQILGQWKRTHRLNPPENRPRYGLDLEDTFMHTYDLISC